MRNLSSYIHAKNLKFGLYGASSVVTCAKREGNLFHEEQDAQTLADWGVDYWKYDACGEDNLHAYAKFTVMRDALNRTGRPMVYSYEPDDHLPMPVEWVAFTGNSWRIASDISSGWGSVMGTLMKANKWANGEWIMCESEISRDIVNDVRVMKRESMNTFLVVQVSLLY